MNKIVFLYLFWLLPMVVVSQTESELALDSLYREDQIYIGVTYNTFIQAPESLSQTNFSPGFKVGFIRDFPINYKRNIAIGLGVGYALNAYSQNLKISADTSGNLNYEFLTGQNYQKNRFSYQAVEIPIEFRWRTSNAQSYKFWRIYSGFKASYIFTSKSLYRAENQTEINRDLDLNPWQYGLTLSAGYNNWNASLYYGLNSIFENASTAQTSFEMKSLRIGIMFYIL